MYRIFHLDKIISDQLQQLELDNTHIPSGKLSAGMLGEPLQWQILKSLGIGQRVIDEYTLRKFARGRDVEEWYLAHITNSVLGRQQFTEYRGAIGYCDAVIDVGTIELAGKIGDARIPLEVKSVTNAKFKNISKSLQADEMHKLQGCFYAAAMGANYYGITYIAADDYRTLTWVYAVKDLLPEVDRIIDAYNAQIGLGQVPIFVAHYPWQTKPLYNKYPQWLGLDQKQINAVMAKSHATAWKDYYAKAKSKAAKISAA